MVKIFFSQTELARNYLFILKNKLKNHNHHHTKVCGITDKL